ncbi:uncharacterized protein TNCV_4999631 [Trichonephila clavipes]|nr:uncharacterized protein TNCV_4999631 [Trichonephila clavipes]
MNYEIQLQLTLLYHPLALGEDSLLDSKLVLAENGRGVSDFRLTLHKRSDNSYLRDEQQICVESRLHFSSDDNRVRVWRSRGERLNPAFALQRHTTPTAGVMVWGAIAYHTRSPLVLIRGTMTTQRYVHDILQLHVLTLMQRLPGSIFEQDNAQPQRQGCRKTVSALLLTFLCLPDPQICLQSSVSGII